MFILFLIFPLPACFCMFILLLKLIFWLNFGQIAILLLLKVSFFEWTFWCIQIYQKPTKFLQGFLPYFLKRDHIKNKIKALYYTNYRQFNIIKCLHFLLLDLFLEARAEILKIFRLYFGRNNDFIILFWDLLTFRCHTHF